MNENFPRKPILGKHPEREESPRKSDEALVNNFLESFEFGTLQKLLAEELRKSDGDTGKASRVTRKNFKPGDRRRMIARNAWGTHKEGLVEINPAAIEAGEMEAIDTTIHEALHLVGDNNFQYRQNRIAHWLFGSAYLGSGLVPSLAGATNAQSLIMPLTIGAFFMILKLWKNAGFRTRTLRVGGALADEGMTVLMTTELTPQFLEQTGRKGLANIYRTHRVDLNFGEAARDSFGGAYPLGQSLMLHFIRAVAQKSIVSGDDVWKGFKRQYLTKGLNPEVARIFDGVFGDDFMKKIKELNADEKDWSKIDDILRKYFDRSITVEIAPILL